MRIYNAFMIIALFPFLFSCQNDLISENQTNEKVPVSFKSAISSRNSGSIWSKNDQIGVFMIKSSNTLTNDNIVNGGNNVCFCTSEGDGMFTTNSYELDYPNDNSDVDFIAYYPYQSKLSNFNYTIDISDQSNQKTFDLLYSNNLTERSKTSCTGNLQFNHVLSQLSINITTSDNSSTDNIETSISGVKTKGSFDFSKGLLSIDNSTTSTISMFHSGNSFEATLLPTESTDEIKIILKLGNKSKELSLPSKFTSFKSGESYTYSINVSGTGTVNEEASYTKWRETPVITKDLLSKSNIHYINHYMPKDNDVRNYSLLYDSDLKMAYWVAYPYCSYYSGSANRTDAWAYDPSLATNLQPDLSSSFSGYDRGHQIPSADRLKDSESNATTFYYTNMTPQVGTNFNSGIWANLETKVRAWSSATDTIFVVTGASATTKSNSEIKYILQNGQNVAVPKYYYKALARKVNGVFQTIAFKFDNKTYSDANSYMNYALSVSDLETETGFTFFPTISSDIKSILNKNQWQ